MSTFTTATIYAKAIPVDPIIDIVSGVVREVTGVPPIRIIAQGGGSYEFEMRGDASHTRRMTMFTRNGDALSAEEMASNGIEDPRFREHEGYVMSFSMGSGDYAKDMVRRVAQHLTFLGPAVISDDLTDEPYEVVDTCYGVDTVLELQGLSVYRAQQIAETLASGGIDEAVPVLEKIKSRSAGLDTSEMTRKNGFAELIIDAPSDPDFEP